MSPKNDFFDYERAASKKRATGVRRDEEITSNDVQPQAAHDIVSSYIKYKH